MTTYYVSKSGNNNNPGTQSSPWLTIQKAANSIASGDTVLIQRGTYNEAVKINTSGLSNSERTIFSSYPGDERLVVIDGTGLGGGNLGLVNIQANYVTFQNIKVQNVAIGQPGTGIYAGDSSGSPWNPQFRYHDITIFNCYTYNTSGLGIEGVNCSSLKIDSNEIELAANGNWTECFDIINCNGFEISNNYIHDGGSGAGGGNGGEGVTVDACQNGTIHHNKVKNIKKVGLWTTNYTPGGTLNWNVQNVDIYSNLVYDCGTGTSISVATETSGFTNNVNVYNNVLYYSPSYGAGLIFIDAEYITNGLTNVKFINNTLGNGSFYFAGSYYSNIIVRNTVCNLINGDTSGVTMDHNWLMANQGSSGLFVNPGGYDYHLTANSKLIDIGTLNGAPSFDFDGNARPQGAGFDIGAYEYVSTTPTLSATLSVSPNTVTLGQSVTFTTTVSGGQPPYNYSYSGLPSPCSGNISSITCIPNTVGTYNVSVKVTDANNIFATSPIVQLTVNPQTTANPIFIQEAETAWNSTISPKTTPSFNVKKGDILVAYSMMENYGTLTISGGSLTWVLRQRVLVASYAPVYVWTATVDVDKTMSVKFSTSSTLFFGGNVLTFRNSSGIGNSSKTNVSSGAPILNITTTKSNSAIVVANCDWIALDGSSRIWRTNAGTFNEKSYFRDSSRYTVYGGYHPNAGVIGTYAVGLSSPSGQKYSIVAVEIKG